jgi:hypothetical protein
VEKLNAADMLESANEELTHLILRIDQLRRGRPALAEAARLEWLMTVLALGANMIAEAMQVAMLEEALEAWDGS